MTQRRQRVCRDGPSRSGGLANRALSVRHSRSEMAHLVDELLGRGIYSVPDAARLAGISASRLRRWLRGYHFSHAGDEHRSRPVVHGELPIMDHALALSFLDLQEARCIDEFRKRGVGWVALREAHEKAERELDTRHPFSTGQFKTAGRRIMWDFATERGDPVLMDLAKNQLAFRQVLARYLRGLEFLRDVPVRWFPLLGSKRVVIDPKRAFGHPIVAKRGVPTSILSRAYKAEGSIEKVAHWYEVDVRSVRDAVRYENDLAA